MPLKLKAPTADAHSPSGSRSSRSGSSTKAYKFLDYLHIVPRICWVAFFLYTLCPVEEVYMGFENIILKVYNIFSFLYPVCAKKVCVNK